MSGTGFAKHLSHNSQNKPIGLDLGWTRGIDDSERSDISSCLIDISERSDVSVGLGRSEMSSGLDDSLRKLEKRLKKKADRKLERQSIRRSSWTTGRVSISSRQFNRVSGHGDMPDAAIDDQSYSYRRSSEPLMESDSRQLDESLDSSSAGPALSPDTASTAALTPVTSPSSTLILPSSSFGDVATVTSSSNRIPFKPPPFSNDPNTCLVSTFKKSKSLPYPTNIMFHEGLSIGPKKAFSLRGCPNKQNPNSISLSSNNGSQESILDNNENKNCLSASCHNVGGTSLSEFSPMDDPSRGDEVGQNDQAIINGPTFKKSISLPYSANKAHQADVSTGPNQKAKASSLRGHPKQKPKSILRSSSIGSQGTAGNCETNHYFSESCHNFGNTSPSEAFTVDIPSRGVDTNKKNNRNSSVPDFNLLAKSFNSFHSTKSFSRNKCNTSSQQNISPYSINKQKVNFSDVSYATLNQDGSYTPGDDKMHLDSGSRRRHSFVGIGNPSHIEFDNSLKSGGVGSLSPPPFDANGERRNIATHDITSQPTAGEKQDKFHCKSSMQFERQHEEKDLIGVIDLTWTDLSSQCMGKYTGTVNQSIRPHGKGKFSFGPPTDDDNMNLRTGEQQPRALVGEWEDGYFVSHEDESGLTKPKNYTNASFINVSTRRKRRGSAGNIASSISSAVKSLVLERMQSLAEDSQLEDAGLLLFDEEDESSLCNGGRIMSEKECKDNRLSCSTDPPASMSGNWAPEVSCVSSRRKSTGCLVDYGDVIFESETKQESRGATLISQCSSTLNREKYKGAQKERQMRRKSVHDRTSNTEYAELFESMMGSKLTFNSAAEGCFFTAWDASRKNNTNVSKTVGTASKSFLPKRSSSKHGCQTSSASEMKPRKDRVTTLKQPRMSSRRDSDITIYDNEYGNVSRVVGIPQEKVRPGRRHNTGDYDEVVNNQRRRCSTGDVTQTKPYVQFAHHAFHQHSGDSGCRTLRKRYRLGDEVRSSSDMVIEPSEEDAICSISLLRVYDFVFIKRSTGSWTYSILADRIREPSCNSSQNDNKNDVEVMIFVLDEAGGTKRVNKSKWASCVRRICGTQISINEPPVDHSKEESAREFIDDFSPDPPGLDEVECDFLNSTFLRRSSQSTSVGTLEGVIDDVLSLREAEGKTESRTSPRSCDASTGSTSSSSFVFYA